MLKNVSREEVQAFVQQVELVPMIGEENPDAVAREIGACSERNPGPYPHPFKAMPIERILVPEPERLTLAPTAQAQQSAASAAAPRVLLVADLSKADTPGDACAEIIHLVRAARSRGVAVQELSPCSSPDLLARYRVLAIPTALILDQNGQVVSRFEGEGRKTVTALKAKLEQLR